MRTVMLAAALAVLAGAASAQTAQSRYAVDVSVMAKGVAVTSGRTSITEGGQAEILLTGADGQYTFTADLQAEQGDGGENRLVLEAYLNHDGADLANPRLVLTRDSRALMQIGSKAGDAENLTDGIEIRITPLSAD